METLGQYIGKRWKHFFKQKSMREDPFGTIFRAFIWVIHCTFKLPAIAKLKPWDVKLFLPPKLRRGGGTMIYIAREYYEPEIKLLDYLLSPGDIFIDGGANLGVFTVIASKLVGIKGKVLAFEPAEENFKLLKKNIELNHQQNVNIYSIALSNKEGETKLHHIDNAPTSYSFGDDSESSIEYEVIKTTTLDSIIEDSNLNRVDVIKLDVEGAEELVFQGATKVLEEFSPIIIFEIRKLCTDRMGLDQFGALNILKDLEYDFYKVNGESGQLSRLTSQPSNGNYIAIKDIGRYKKLNSCVN